MKKKILTYMMTAMVMLGVVGVGTPITAYARLNLPDEWFQEIPEEGIDIQKHDFGTGETWIEHIDKGTPEQNAEGYIRRCRGIGRLKTCAFIECTVTYADNAIRNIIMSHCLPRRAADKRRMLLIIQYTILNVIGFIPCHDNKSYKT